MAQSASSAPNMSSTASRQCQTRREPWKRPTSASLALLPACFLFRGEVRDAFHPRLRGCALPVCQLQPPPRAVFHLHHDGLQERTSSSVLKALRQARITHGVIVLELVRPACQIPLPLIPFSLLVRLALLAFTFLFALRPLTGIVPGLHELLFPLLLQLVLVELNKRK
jgi:hypothetical protein